MNHRIALPVTLSMLLIFTGCLSSQFSSNTTKTLAFQLEQNSSPAIFVNARNGAIRVHADPSATEIQITANLKAYGATPDAAERNLEELEVFADRSANGIDVGFHEPDQRFMYSVGFEIVVPPRWKVEAESSNGNIEIDGTLASVIADTSNSAVRIRNAIGDVRVDTSNGSVTIEDSIGNVQLDTSNARVTLKDVELVGDNWIDTSNARVVVKLPPTSPLLVSADTSNAKIRCDIDGYLQIKSEHDFEGYLFGDRDSTENRLRIKTSNGEIRIRGSAEETIKEESTLPEIITFEPTGSIELGEPATE